MNLFDDPPKRPPFLPRAVQPSEEVSSLGGLLEAVGWRVDEAAVLKVGRGAGPELGRTLVLVGSAEEGLAAVRSGALAVAVWPAEQARLGDLLETACTALEDRVLAAARQGAWHAGQDWRELGDPDARLVEVNPAFEELSGWPATEAIGRTPAELFRAGTHSPGFYAEVFAASGTRGWSGGFVGRRRDGSWSVQDVQVDAVRLEGRPLLFFADKRPLVGGPTSSLSARIREEVSSPWWLVRRDGAVVVEGWSGGVGAVAARVGETLAAHGLGDLELPPPGGRVRQDRRWHDAVFAIQASGLRVGDLDLVLLVFDDVTERVHREEQVVALAAELRAARDLARSASEAKSAFLAGMSHELRTPLCAMIGYAELLLESGHPAEDELHRVQSSGQQLLSLVDDLLDLSRIEAGKVEVEWSEVPIGPLLEEVADTLRLRAESRGQRLVVQSGGGVVRTDRRRLRQILLNFLTNATRYAVPGRVTLGVQDGHRLVVWVEDEGPGLSPEQVGRLFQPWSRVGPDVGGLGLGLSICARLGSLLGLDLGVVSAPGEGSRFEVRFPVQ